MDILQITSISKQFGSHRVLDALSFSVKEGSIFGFIGQNGAGKTTTMKMILGLLPIDSGEITVCGERVRYGENKTNQFIGYLPDVPEFYNYMNSTEYLKLCGEITGIPKEKLCLYCWTGKHPVGAIDEVSSDTAYEALHVSSQS